MREDLRRKFEEGQAMVEYAVLFSTIVIAGIIAFGSMAKVANRLYDLIQNVLIPAFS